MVVGGVAGFVSVSIVVVAAGAADVLESIVVVLGGAADVLDTIVVVIGVAAVVLVSIVVVVGGTAVVVSVTADFPLRTQPSKSRTIAGSHAPHSAGNSVAIVFCAASKGVEPPSADCNHAIRSPQL